MVRQAPTDGQDAVTWRIAGGSGDGIDSTSQNYAKALMRGGLHVFTHRHYPSRIRGGHTYVEVGAAPEPVRARGDACDFLLALGDSFAQSETPADDPIDEETKPLADHLDDLAPGAVIVYDEGLLDEADLAALDLDARAEEHDWHVYPMDLREIATSHGPQVMRNTAGLGATTALLEQDTDHLEALLEETLPGDVVEANLAVFREAHDRARAFEFTHDLRMPTGDHADTQALINGSEAIAYAALDAGCRFISGYPMTPWTEVFSVMSKHLPAVGGVAEQVEDEIAAATAALGASHAGAKAMSGSSGGGFALMSEPLGLAEMTETPVVFVEAMRAGPSTGLPTKTEQSDLEHVLYSSQGDSCRVVFAPGNIREAYQQTRTAFRLAYDYQLPAIVVYDQKLEGEMRSVPVDVFDREPDPSLGPTVSEADLTDDEHRENGRFRRYRHDAEDGVSPRAIPGQAGGRFLATGNESDETGHICEDPDNRQAQMDRRLGKLDTIRAELSEGDTHQTTHGPADADHGVIVWGSHQDTVFEAVDRLNAAGHSVRALGVSELLPFPTAEVEAFLAGVDASTVVEMNASGQFRGLLERELGAHDHQLSGLTRYDGEPFRPADVVEGVAAAIDGEQPADQTAVVEVSD